MSATTSRLSTSNPATVQMIRNPTLKWIGRGFAAVVFLISIITIIYNIRFAYVIYTNPNFSEVQAGIANLGISSELFAAYYISLYLVRVLVSLAIGALILWLRSDTVLGVLAGIAVLGIATVFSTQTSLGTLQLDYTLPALLNVQEPTQISLFVAAFPNTLSTIAYFLVAPTILLYPNGKLQPNWCVIPIVTYAILAIAWEIIPSVSAYHPTNWRPVISLVFNVALWGSIIAGLWVRYRRYFTLVEKQQSKWFLFAIVIVGITALFDGFGFQEPLTSASVLGDGIGAIFETSLIVVPISIAIALFRYRLWDIDLVINRSLVFGAILGVALVTFFGVLFGLQLLGSTQPLLALVISVVVTVLLYKPLRPRVQRFVDYRIYGFRYGMDDIREAQKPIIITKAGAYSGQTFGDYLMLDLLGQGGMGEVYKAQKDDKFIAIKTLVASGADILTRFKREAEIGMTLQHPNIVRVYDVADHNGLAYIVMQYVDGEDLSDYLKRATPTFERTCAILRDIAAALDVIHEQGFIHRDIKPSNMMIDLETNTAMLTDFGVSKITDATSFTGTGAIGTIDYMSPEQIQSASQVDHRADIYALGIVAYEMLTGQKPFGGGVGQVLFAQLQQPAPDPRDIDEDIPRNAAKSVIKAMAKDPSERYTSAGAFVEAFSN